jgi:hypothetical protein
LQHKNKISGATTIVGRPNEAVGWFDTPCYYVSIAYGGSQMGLLVRADGEERARREADRLCTCFGAMARTLSVRKVVIQ